MVCSSTPKLLLPLVTIVPLLLTFRAPLAVVVPPWSAAAKLALLPPVV